MQAWKERKNLPPAAPIADSQASSETRESHHFTKHDRKSGTRFSEKIMLKQQTSATAFSLSRELFCHGTALANQN
jgi:dihydrodipicolinate reductase